MLSSWQIFLLDISHWIIPILATLSLVTFPWKHWNTLLKKTQ